MSTKYNGINPARNCISKTGKIVIYNVPIAIKRALRFQSEKAGDSSRDCGSESDEGYKAILYYLTHAKRVSVENILKSGV